MRRRAHLAESMGGLGNGAIRRTRFLIPKVGGFCAERTCDSSGKQVSAGPRAVQKKTRLLVLKYVQLERFGDKTRGDGDLRSAVCGVGRPAHNNGRWELGVAKRGRTHFETGTSRGVHFEFLGFRSYCSKFSTGIVSIYGEPSRRALARSERRRWRTRRAHSDFVVCAERDLLREGYARTGPMIFVRFVLMYSITTSGQGQWSFLASAKRPSGEWEMRRRGEWKEEAARPAVGMYAFARSGGNHETGVQQNHR